MFYKFIKCQIIFTLICHAFCHEPTEEDLKCFNDYETEIKCSLSTDRLKSCSGYKLNISRSTEYNMFLYACTFEKSHQSDNCECKIKVQGFVITETFNTTLLEGTNVLSRRIMITDDFIKPKTPVLSVQITENGNFNVTWDDQYEISEFIGRPFLEDLKISLTYGIKGELEIKNISKTMSNTVGSFEIVGKNLQPNTNYILTATMSTGYNGHSISSDQSAPVEFTSPSSPNEMAKMVIIPLCVGLIIIICVIFFCILRMKTNWWDKISKPKINDSPGKQKDAVLFPSNIKFYPIHVKSLDPQEDKKFISALSVDTNNDKSYHSAESGPVDYGEAGENISPNDITSRVEQALNEVFRSHLITNNQLPLSPYNQVTTSMSNESVNGLSSSREHNRANRDSGNCSGSSVFSNMSYLESATGDSLFLEQLSGKSSKTEVLDSDARGSQFNSHTTNTLEEGYQSFGSVLKKGNDADICANLLDEVGADEKHLTTNLITSANPLYPSQILRDGSVTLSDEAYQDFQCLTKSTEGQWSTSVSTEQALNACGALKFPQSTGQDPTSLLQSSWATSLHFSPIIQIDSSYQCV